MDLLSSADRIDIRAAIQDVADTFFTTPCSISVRVDNPDRMGRQDGLQYTPYTVHGLLEFSNNQKDEVFLNEDGAVIRADIKVTLGVDDMDTAGLLDTNNQPIINMATDKITIYGIAYRIILCAMEGSIGTSAARDKNLICCVYGNREPTPTY